jgi:MFS family permease
MVEIKFSALKQTKPHELLVRFLFGGLATVLAGLVAKRFGPGIGGLFLAFPAIFPATATLVEAHEKERKKKIGHDGTCRGRMAASVDAAGTALGCIALAGFAFVLWRALPSWNSGMVIAGAVVAWVLIAFVLWELRKNRIFGRRRH